MSTLSLPAPLPTRVIPKAKTRAAKLTLWPLVAATFFMVSGGTYGTEEIVHGPGYGRAILILVLTPLLWSLPTAFMIGELSSALPAEGGYYAWVRRGLGNFWGFQEAWLSLVASIFDMAIYPTLFVGYLTQIAPWFREGHRGVMVGLFVVIACAALNLAGIRVVGLTSLWLFFLLSMPFAAIVLLSPFKLGAAAGGHLAPITSTVGLLGGTLIAMWNYMGWDNASTIAKEVERPHRTDPKAMIAAVILVTLTYVLPFLAVYLAGVPASAFAGDGVDGDQCAMRESGGQPHQRRPVPLEKPLAQDRAVFRHGGRAAAPHQSGAVHGGQSPGMGTHRKETRSQAVSLRGNRGVEIRRLRVLNGMGHRLRHGEGA